MRREQFTFYRSFWNAMQALPREERAAFVEALCSYAMDEEEPDLDGTASAAAVFCVIRPILDKARQKAESGRAGGKKSNAGASKPKQKKTRLSNQDKQVTETETETVTDTETGPEDDKDPPAPLAEERPRQEAVPPAQTGQSSESESESESVVVAVRGVVGEMSHKAARELHGFLRDMGPDCVLRALDAAQDAGKPSWSYVRGILRRKQSQGVASAADWDRSEDAHARAVEQLRADAEARKRPAIAGTPVNVQPSDERAQRSAARLKAFLEQQEKKGGEQAS